MANIPVIQARARFTQQLVARWNERVQVKNFLRSLTQEVKTNSKLVSIEVKRGGQKVAVDVIRGSEGTMVRSSLGTQRVYEPPFYKLKFSHTELDLYDYVFGENVSEVSPVGMNELLNEITERYADLQNMMERRYELQAAQVLSTGQVTMKNGATIDYKRKAGSLVTVAAADKWNAGTADIEAQLIAAGNFLRKDGKSSSYIINTILGDEASLALSQNEKLQKKLDIKAIDMGLLKQEVVNSAGGTPIGYLTAGNYKFILWGYGEYYEDPDNSNVVTPFIDPKKAIFLPTDAEIKTAFAGVPTLLKFANQQGGMNGAIANRSGYVADNFIKEEEASHIFTLSSAGLVVPVSIDKIYTSTVL